MIGFAYFNRPVARLFLGDVGSLPIGLLLGWLLLLVATSGHLAAAILLPLYYLADATITLLRRLIRREPVWQAHRTHFYQLATDRGFTVMQVVTRVFFVNVVLAASGDVDGDRAQPVQRQRRASRRCRPCDVLTFHVCARQAMTKGDRICAIVGRHGPNHDRSIMASKGGRHTPRSRGSPFLALWTTR